MMTDIATPVENILSVAHWSKSRAFKAIKDKETQIKYYQRMGACTEVLQLVDLESKPFGTACENILSETLELGPRTSSQNDGTRGKHRIETKTARYWAGKDDCRWQHLEPDHDYDVVLFALLDFHSFKVWAISKELLMGELRAKKVVTYQGKQGWWCNKSALMPYLTSITSIADLDAFLSTVPAKHA
jgi:hypothetical protein